MCCLLAGFVVPQEVPQHSWLRRGVPAPVNRYNLRPGRHWDGVDRSTGFEKEMFKMVNQKNAQELEARMWAQEDM
jgi:pre-mRNA-splicing factor CWC26